MSVDYEVRDRVALITIDRPERRNAIDRATANALAEAWRRFDGDDSADVAVLWGNGGHFCAGADLKAFDLVDNPGGPLGFTRMKVSKPTIAAVEGSCVAGGLEMALWCDLRVVGRSAVMGCLERRFGVPLIDGGTQRLPRIVGMGRALDLILTGRTVDAEEAAAIGLVTSVVEDGSARDAALALAARIASFPQETVRSDRLALLEGIGRPLGEGLEVERRHGIRVMDTARQGAARFAAGAGRGGTDLTEDDEPPTGGGGTLEVEVVPDTAEQVEEEKEAPPLSASRQGRVPVHVFEPASHLGPGVLLLHDRSGFTGSVREAASGLAGAGYLVAAPDLYRGELPGDGQRAAGLIASLDPDAVARVLLGIVGRMLEEDRVTSEGIAVVGLGMGGGIARWLATLDHQIVACVSFGGGLPWPQVSPSFRTTRAAFLGHHAEHDPDAGRQQAYDLETRLRELGLDATFHTYPGAHAGFWDPERPDRHHRAMAELAWERTRLFLERALR